MMIQFFMAMIPPTVTQQQHRIAPGGQGKRARVYDSDRLRDARQKLTAHLNEFRPSRPMEGAVRLIVKWCFPVTSGHMDGEYKITRPDTDNLQKLLKDCMTKVGFWKDDAQVASELVEKFYSDIPGIMVIITGIEE